MAGTFLAEIVTATNDFTELRIGFGTPAQTPQIVIDAVQAFKD